MDGLTISTANSLLKTGKTVSEIRENQLKNDAGPMVDNAEGPSFANSLNEAINKVNTIQKDSDLKMQQLATGESKNIPEVMIAAEKADIAFKLMVQVRNKLIDAYQEIMKMQV